MKRRLCPCGATTLLPPLLQPRRTARPSLWRHLPWAETEECGSGQLRRSSPRRAPSPPLPRPSSGARGDDGGARFRASGAGAAVGRQCGGDGGLDLKQGGVAGTADQVLCRRLLSGGSRLRGHGGHVMKEEGAAPLLLPPASRGAALLPPPPPHLVTIAGHDLGPRRCRWPLLHQCLQSRQVGEAAESGGRTPPWPRRAQKRHLRVRTPPLPALLNRSCCRRIEDQPHRIGDTVVESSCRHGDEQLAQDGATAAGGHYRARCDAAGSSRSCSVQGCHRSTSRSCGWRRGWVEEGEGWWLHRGKVVFSHTG
jgi:hypothetical protein